MVLSELIRVLPRTEVRGATDREIGSIAYDSRQVAAGGLFLALRGARQDGHHFIGAALDRGAVAIVLENFDPGIPAATTQILVPDSREALALIGACFYGYPARKLRMIGLTGTNGKTTTAYLVEALLKTAGFKTGVLGTIEYRCGGRTWPAPVTTPESLDLHYYLAEMVREGATHVVMEVSSHALEQGRCRGIEFEVGLFTNLTQDHLDYHRDMESYYQAKAKLFFHYLQGTPARPDPLAIINRDDPFGERLWTEVTGSRQDFSLQGNAAYQALEIRTGFRGNEVRVRTPRGIFELHSLLLGRHNVYNLLAAWAVGEAFQVPEETICRGLASLQHVPGRMELVPNPKGLAILVDYAHTPEALRFVLQSLRELTSHKIITVFGCGGDRDATKRPHMGRIAGDLSHLAVITSDNPRTEDPLKIIGQIETGLLEARHRRYDPWSLDRLPDQPGYCVIPDRRQAIARAVHWAGSDEVLLIAGKGHETVQLLGDQVLFFDDRLEAGKAAEADLV
ncbi:MAG: UDP-N-acetylmuramoyl-L-alanyl-D-glutamate--2,6-diaminopimelate ligase [Deltaproteobacteria bacterium]|nr:UDP-N-acetylmuramoyl-L-alanyl-D-glutamate--2,6-diaminopimelate ligase [Deltaproteobacteria bacterium]